MSDIDTSTCSIIRISDHSCKPIQFSVLRDRSNQLISLESSEHGLQKYPFIFFRFCFIVEKIELFPHLVAKSDKIMKNMFVFSGFYYHGSAKKRNRQHIRHQRQKLHRIIYVLRNFFSDVKLTAEGPEAKFQKNKLEGTTGEFFVGKKIP